MSTEPPLPFSVSLLWNHTSSIYPHEFRLYAEDMIRRDRRLEISSHEIDDVCSFMFSRYVITCKKMPSRSELVNSMSSITEEQMNEVVDLWAEWIKSKIQYDSLEKAQLDLLSDIIFLEYKKLSLDNNEDEYISYLKHKFKKQLDRPEHKLFTLFRIMKSVHIDFKTNKIVERLL
jgi:hypothetical protein